MRRYSLRNCEAQVAEQAARLAEWLDELVIIHLMANRERERTAVGFWRGAPRAPGPAALGREGATAAVVGSSS